MNIVEKSYTYYQESDVCDPDDIGQHLIVQTQDNGTGYFLTIKTDRWAIDESDIDEFCNTLKQILKDMNAKPLTRAPNDVCS